MVFEVCREKTGTTSGIVDGVVEKKFRVEEVGCWRCRIVRVSKFVTPGNISDSPLFRFERAVIADKRSVSNIPVAGDFFSSNKFYCVCRFNTMNVPLC